MSDRSIKHNIAQAGPPIPNLNCRLLNPGPMDTEIRLEEVHYLVKVHKHKECFNETSLQMQGRGLASDVIIQGFLVRKEEVLSVSVKLLKDRENRLKITDDPVQFAKTARAILTKLNHIPEGESFIPSSVMINSGELTLKSGDPNH